MTFMEEIFSLTIYDEWQPECSMVLIWKKPASSTEKNKNAFLLHHTDKKTDKNNQYHKGQTSQSESKIEPKIHTRCHNLH